MNNFAENMEQYIGNLEEIGMEMLDLAKLKIHQLETDKAELDALVLEQSDTIIELRRELARLNERTGG